MKRLFKKLRRIWLFIRHSILGTPVPFQTVYVDELPDDLKNGEIYLIGENGFLWSAALSCPCGCRSVIQLNLLPEAKPCWRVETHADDTITLKPSVWSKKGCGSHYFIRNGLINWCFEE